ncbi:MAG: peptidoglycan DD-metalloendopeptidase family protein [Thermoanaerobaculia bacterium]
MHGLGKGRLLGAFRYALPVGGIVACLTVGMLTLNSGKFEPLSLATPLPTLETESAGPLAARGSTPVDFRFPSAAPDRTSSLRSGDTLGAVLRRLGLSASEAESASKAAQHFVDLRQLRAGTRYAAYYDGADLGRFELAIDGRGDLALERESAEWVPRFRAYERKVEVASVRGELRDSLEDAVVASGAPADLAYAMAEVLQWDLDFNRDLRSGDRFEILYERVLVDGKYAGIGSVLAASYTNRGHAVEAFRYSDPEPGYYDASGRPLTKMFLRSPLPFSRVTSRFSGHRFHPILKQFRPHYGVDYAAPVGTPARATAAGTVIFAGWDGGGGRAVKIRHPNDFETCYLHLSRFAEGVRAGARVGQGEVIGYVGQSGLATGPHLDYRIQHRGKWMDPLSLKAIPTDPLGPLALSRFTALRDAMRVSLESGGPFVAPSFAGAGGERVASRGAGAPTTLRR